MFYFYYSIALRILLVLTIFWSPILAIADLQSVFINLPEID